MQVSARVTRDSDLDGMDTRYRRTVELPTFYLLADVQGIVDERHAKQIVTRMLISLGHEETDIYVSVCETSAAAH